MIEREYHIMEWENGCKRFYIVCKNMKNVETLNMFLSDVSCFPEWIKEAVDDVLSGKIECFESSGNACSFKICSDITEIYDEVTTEDEDEYYSTRCEVDTKELRKVIEEMCYMEAAFNQLYPRDKHSADEVEVKDKEVQENVGKFSTFFPKTWSPQDVVDAINEANNSRHFQRGSGNKYIGTSASYGIKIEIYLDRDGKIAAAYPAK